MALMGRHGGRSKHRTCHVGARLAMGWLRVPIAKERVQILGHDFFSDGDIDADRMNQNQRKLVGRHAAMRAMFPGERYVAGWCERAVGDQVARMRSQRSFSQ